MLLLSNAPALRNLAAILTSSSGSRETAHDMLRMATGTDGRIAVDATYVDRPLHSCVQDSKIVRAVQER